MLKNLALLALFTYQHVSAQATVKSNKCSSLMYFSGMKLNEDSLNFSTISADDFCQYSESSRTYTLGTDQGQMIMQFNTDTSGYWTFWGISFC